MNKLYTPDEIVACLPLTAEGRSETRPGGDPRLVFAHGPGSARPAGAAPLLGPVAARRPSD